MKQTMMKWWQRTLVYQIYPKSFLDTTGSGTGDLKGITAKLDYLQSLGAGALWLTPVYPSPMVDNGYDIADYCAIDPAYGTMADMEELIAEARKRGIRIVMDLVYNHSSDQHPWFLASRRDKQDPKRGWYIWRDPRADGSAPTNWRSIFGGPAWTLDDKTGQYYLHTFAAGQPDLNWENPEVRKALFASANFWLDKGIGGFRIDAITYIKKPALVDGVPDAADGLAGIHGITANTPGILDFLHEFRREVFEGHDIFTVGEANGVAADELPDWVGADGVFDMLFEFSHVNLGLAAGQEVWCHPCRWQLQELKKALFDSQAATARQGWCPIFLENHDQRRAVDHFFPKPIKDKARGAKLLGMLLFTLRGTPFVYEGQELGFANMELGSIEAYDDISSQGQYDLALAEGKTPAEALHYVQYFSRDNARTPMQWDAGPQAGFTSGEPWLPVHPDYRQQNAAAEQADVRSVLHWFRWMARLRAESRVLLAGMTYPCLVDDAKVMAFDRALDGEVLRIVLNFTEETAEVPRGFLMGSRLAGNYEGMPGERLRPLEALLLRRKERDI
jgi:alpha-glucosidase